MKTLFYFLAIAILLQACSASRIALQQNNFDKATILAVEKLVKNKNKHKQIEILEAAFNSANKKDESIIQALESQHNDANAERIFKLYASINQRQTMVKQLLPLYHKKSNQALNLYFVDVNKMSDARNKTIEYNYQKAMQLMLTKNKFDAQKAYTHFLKVQQYNSAFANISNLIYNAKQAGTFRYALAINYPNQYQNAQFEQAWQSIAAANLCNTWCVYEVGEKANVVYDAVVVIDYEYAQFSPDLEHADSYTEINKVDDGFETIYVLGKKNDTIRVDQKKKFKVYHAKVNVIEKTKTATIKAIVSIEKNGVIVSSQAMSYTFEWKNIAASYRGDFEALSYKTKALINNVNAFHPNNDYMMFQAHDAWAQLAKRYFRNQL